MMPPCSCLVPERNPGTSERQQKQTKGIPDSYKTGGLSGAATVKNSGKNYRIIGDHADHVPAQSRKANPEISGPTGSDFEKTVPVNHVENHFPYIVRLIAFITDNLRRFITFSG